MFKKVCALFSSIAFLLGGCSDQTTQDYAQRKPTLDLRSFLDGDVEAWGIFYDFRGKPDLQFHVAMKGSWNGQKGVLDEVFVYSDGRKENRVWNITFHDDHHFTAESPDVVGGAVGTQHGNTANMKYVLAVKRANGDVMNVKMDDWLYKIDDNTLINRIKMTKFGLKVGELVLSFRKR